MKRLLTSLFVILAVPSLPSARGQTPVLHERLPAPTDRQTPFTSPEALSSDDGADDGPLFSGDEGADGETSGGGFSVDAVPRLSPPGDVRLDDRTGLDEVLTYFAVFDPSVAPFKRSYVRDRVREDGALVVSDPGLRPLPPDRRPQRALLVGGGDESEDRELFWGSLLVELADGRPVPIPSVAAGGAVLELETVPALDVELLIDGADNLYLRSDASGRVRLNVVVDAPRGYFGGPLPEDVTLGALPHAVPPESAPVLPDEFRAAARGVFAAIRAARGRPRTPIDDVSLAEALGDLTGHFRGFEAGALPHVPDDPIDRYRTIALGRRGVCRHRAYAFVVTAQALGLPARYVVNEAHAFAEVLLPLAVDGSEGAERGATWRRIDLGGGAAGFDVRGATHRARHVPGEGDSLPRPSAYDRSYSALPRPGEGRPDPRDGYPMRGSATRGDRGLDGSVDAGSSSSVTLDRAAAHVFRGETVAVSGQVSGSAPGRQEGRLVEVLILPSIPSRPAQRLGLVPVDRRGRFAADLQVPPAVRPGRYRLTARLLEP